MTPEWAPKSVCHIVPVFKRENKDLVPSRGPLEELISLLVAPQTSNDFQLINV